MNVTEKNLKTVYSYAQLVNKRPQTIYRWAKIGKIKSIEIDGVLFIILDKDHD